MDVNQANSTAAATGNNGTAAATSTATPPQQVKASAASVKKSLDIVDPTSAKAKILDISIFGDPNAWLLLAKASSESQGWMKSTKVLPIEKVGCLVQVSTQQRNPDGTYAVAESLEFIPGVKVVESWDGSGKVVDRRLRHFV